jgi:Ca-activated chloride channel family protein
VVRDARAELPEGAVDAEPAGPVPTRDGDEVVVLARVEGAAVGTEAGLAVPRLWARARIAELETRGDDANAEITALAVQHHLLSRATSLLVLENDRMFAEFGIPRTAAPDQAPDVGELQTGHVARAPTVRMGSTMVSGRLPPETVQRIVRQNFGRFRQCFEDGLRRHDALSGRVIARFVIGRDGSVASTVDGGSDLPDAEVVSCVVRSFARLSFPPPEGGTVTVVYPIVFSGEGSGQAKPEMEPQRLSQPLHRTFSPDMGRLPANSALNPPPWQPPPVAPPTVAHRPGDDAWRAARPASLDPLLARVERDPARRRGHADAIRALVAAGRMEDAHASAQRFVTLDPDSPVAREALAETAAATFRRDEAVSAMASAAALDPRSKTRQLGAMRAALAVGDGRRACAHARALGELAPREHATVAEGCRASGSITAPDIAPGGFEAKVTCDGTSCGDVAVITPGGRVLSRWSRGASGGDRIVGPLMAGTYRTLVAPGEASGTVSVRALGVTFDAAIGRGEPRTAIASEVMIPAPYRALRVRI